MPNLGIIHEPIAPDTGFLGGVGGELPDILPSGDWEPYLPKFESQNKWDLETLNCVQYSRLNASEIQANFHGRPLNLSDRGLGWAAENTRAGNTYSKCDYWFRERGACAEEHWPWDKPMTWAEYYAQPPFDVIHEMGLLLDEWEIGMRVYVPNTVDGLRAALRKGPIWFCTRDHSMVIYRADDAGIHILDTYPLQGDGKRHWPLSDVSKIVSAYLVPFTPKHLAPEPMIELPKNSLIVVVDGHGERLMNVDGTKLYQDDAGKILTEVMARNAKQNADGVMMCGEFPEVHVRTSDIVDIPRVNLKGEPVN